MGNSTVNDTNVEPADKDDDEITNVLPIKEKSTSTADHEDEVVYDLIEEKSNEVENSAADENSWHEQIKQLQETQTSMALQLENAFAASDRLARQLKKERHARRASVTSYVALTMAGLALIIGATSAFFAGSLQRDVNDLSTSLSILEQHKHPSENITAAGTKYIHARIDDLAIKFNKAFDGQKTTDKIAKLSSSLTNSAPKTTKNKVVEKAKSISPPTLQTTAAANVVKVENKTAQQNVIKIQVPKLQEKKSPINKPKLKTELVPASIKNKPITKPVIKKDWVVALGSYKNSVTASKNANEYRKAGVPVVISKVNAQGQVWHRLLTKPFSSQQKATLYAEQVKTQLKIESILVTKQ